MERIQRQRKLQSGVRMAGTRARQLSFELLEDRIVLHQPHDPMLGVFLSPDFVNDGKVFAVGEESQLLMISSDRGRTFFQPQDTISGKPVTSIGFSPAFASDGMVFAGTEQEGMFKSQDGGESWAAMADGMSDPFITAIGVSGSFATDETVFVGTASGVLYRSLGGGSEWTEVGSLPGGPITDIAFSPNFSADATMFVAHRGAGVVKSVNAGASWTAVNVGLSNILATSLALSPDFATDQRVVVGTDGGGVHLSSNAGDTWVPINTGLADLRISDVTTVNGTLIATARADGVFMRAAEDAAWNAASAGLREYDQGGDNQFRAVAVSPSFATDHTAFVASFAGLYATRTPESVWVETNILPSQRNLEVAVSPNFASDQTFFAATMGGGLLKTIDGGDRWTVHNQGQPNTFLDNISVSPGYATDETIFAGTFEGVYRSTDGGDSWFVSPLVSDEQKVYAREVEVSSNYPVDQIVLAGVSSAGPTYNGLYRSTNAGTTWALTNTGLPDNPRVNQIAYSPNSAVDATVFAGLNTKGVYKSTNNGISWFPANAAIEDVPINELRVSPTFAVDQTLFAAGQRRLFQSTDGGTSWTEIETGLAGVTAIAVSPQYATDQTLLIGAGPGGVFKSTDGGQSWLAGGELGGATVNDLVLSPNFENDATVFLGSRQGSYKSTDGGSTWDFIQTLNRHDDDPDQMFFQGDWDVIRRPETNGPTIHYSSNAGDRVVFEFFGNEIGVISSRGPNRGLARLYLDGSPQGIVDLYDPDAQAPENVAELTTVTGWHTLTIEVLEASNPASSDQIVTVDAIDVFAGVRGPTASGFVDATAVAGLSVDDRPSLSNPIWGDINGDGFLDLFMSRHFRGYSLYENNQDGTFTDRQILIYGDRDNYDLHAPAFGDFNNDQLLDMFIGYSGAGGPPPGGVVGLKNDQLYINLGDGLLTEVSETAGVQNKDGRVQDVSLIDLDQDGLLDIFVVNRASPNLFHHNNGDGTFSEIALELGLDDAPTQQHPRGTLGEFAAWADFDQDGDLDVFMTRSGDQLLRNDGGTFVDVTLEANLVSGVVHGAAAWGDFNNDTFVDLFVVGRASGRSSSKLYASNGNGTFSDVTDTAGVNSRAFSTPQSAAWGDADNDGDLDLYVINSGIGDVENGLDIFYRNNGDGTFTDATLAEGLTVIASGKGEGVAWGDYDNNGFLDIVINNGTLISEEIFPQGRDILYKNLGNDNHWLKVIPEGTLSNAAGIGAKVTIVVAGQTQFREFIDGGGGKLRSQGHGPIHFGLNGATTVDSLTIEWPSGMVDTYQDIDADQTLHLVETFPISEACGSHPRLSYWPEEVARLQALGDDASLGTLGVSTQDLLADMISRGQNRTFDLERVPLLLPENKGQAKAATDYVVNGVEWAGFMKHVAGDDRHVEFAKQAVLRMANWTTWANPDWDDTNIITSDTLRSNALSLDWFCEDFTTEELQQVVTSALTKGVPLFKRIDVDQSLAFGLDASPNHKMSAATAWGDLAIVLDGIHPEAGEWLERSIYYARESLTTVGGDDGGAFEGVRYAGVLVEFMRGFDLNLAHVTDIQLADESDWIKSFPNYIVHTIGPQNLNVNFNETGTRPYVSGNVLAALVAASNFGDTIEGQRAQGFLAEYVQQTGGLPLPSPASLRYVDNAVPVLPVASNPPEAVFDSVGQAFVRTGWEQEDMLFAFTAQPPTLFEEHRDYDGGNFLLNWGGDELLADAGKPLQRYQADFIPEGVDLPADEVLEIANFTRRTPGHNTITLEKPDGTQITQRDFEVSLTRAQTSSPNLFVEADLGASYQEFGDPTPVLKSAQRRIVGQLPSALLVYDKIETTAETGPLYARFHLHGSTRRLLPDTADITLLDGMSALMTPPDSSHRLRVMAQGLPNVTVETDSLAPQLGEYLVVRNASPEETVELLTLILPEHLTDAAPIVTPIGTPDAVGYEIVRGAITITIRVARFDHTFLLEDGSEAIAELTIQENGEVQTFPVLANPVKSNPNDVATRFDDAPVVRPIDRLGLVGVSSLSTADAVGETVRVAREYDVFQIAGLAGGRLGVADTSTSTIDVAAGSHWFFQSPEKQGTHDRAGLLTSVMLEFAHVRGQEDLHDPETDLELMLRERHRGTRVAADVDAALAIFDSYLYFNLET